MKNSQSGFMLIEALVAIGLAGVLIFSTMFLASTSSKQSSNRLNYDKSYLMIQNLAEALFVSTGAGYTLDEGTWGPKCFNDVGVELTSGDCPIKIYWKVTPDAAMGVFMKIDVMAEYTIDSNTKTSQFTFYRSRPISSFSAPAANVSLPVPTLTFKWYTSSYGICRQYPLATTLATVAAAGAPGRSTRTVNCRASSSSPSVPTSNCTPPAPVNYKDCTYGGPSFNWVVGAWSPCDATETQTRSATCKVDGYLTSGVTQADCTSRGKVKPATTKSCTWVN